MRRLGALLLVLCAGAAAARADESGPRERARAAAHTLPAPTAAGAFEYRCYVLREGAPYGRMTLSAYPARVGAAPDVIRMHWRVRDSIEPLRPGGDRVVSSALVDKALNAVEGTYNRRNAEGFIRAAWQRRADGTFEIQHTTQDYENRLHIPSLPATSTLSALLLFLRQVAPGPAVYELDDFDPNPPAGDAYVAPMRVEVHRKAGWKVAGAVRQAWIVSVSRGNRTLRLALDGETRAFLGAAYIGLPFQFVPEGSGPVGLADATAEGLQTPVERALFRARALRSALPAPTRALRWEGDLRLADTRVGRVLLLAEPTAFGGRPAWRVLESRTSRTGEAVVVYESAGFLDRDLRVLRGERLDRRPEGRSWSTYVRTPGGMETVSTVDGTRKKPELLAAPADAVAGLVPVLLFLRAVPAVPALYVLPGFDPRFASPPKAGTGSLVFNRADVTIDVEPKARLEIGGQGRASMRARCSYRSGIAYDIHVDRESRDLLAVVGRMPTLSYLPPDAAAKKVTWYDAVESAPKSARQAFVKFGRGYHLPRPDLLADVFHWPSLKSQAIRQARYDKDVPEATIRKDWIDVFVGMSKHRTKADCDDLLFQMFMTSTETTNADGSVSIQTLPVYGGHTYRCKQIGERWYIVAID